MDAYVIHFESKRNLKALTNDRIEIKINIIADCMRYAFLSIFLRSSSLARIYVLFKIISFPQRASILYKKDITATTIRPKKYIFAIK